MMKKSSIASSLAVLVLLLLGTVAYILPLAPASAAANGSCTALTNPFSVTGAIWGTATTPTSAYPGSQDVPLTVSLLFAGPCTSPETTFELTLSEANNPVPFTGLNGNPQPSIVVLNTEPSTLLTETFYLNVNQNAQPGVTYDIPLVIQYTNNTASELVTQIDNSLGGQLVVPISLYGPVDLSYQASTSHLVAGAENNVTLTVSNTGSGTSGPVTTTVTAPTGVTLLNQLPATSSLGPGATTTQQLDLFVASSLESSAVVLSLTSKYIDQYDNSQTATETLGFTVGATSIVQPSSAFLVEGANWGTATATTSPFPGTQDEPLVVTLQYLGASSVDSLEGTLQLPSGMTDLNGGGTSTAYSASATNQYGTVSLTFYLDLASSARAGSYNFTLTLQWMTSQSSGLTETATITPPPVAQLESSFQVDSATWEKASSTNSTVSSTSTSPVPGSTDVPLVVTLQYLGTASVSNVEGTLTLPSGITDLNGNPTATAFAASATSNQVITLTFNLDVGNGVKPGSYSFPLALSWTTSVGIGVTQGATVSPPPVASPTTAASFPLSMTQDNTTVTAGSIDPASFTLTNEGTQTIYSPTFSLNTESPVVLSSVGATVPAGELAPGGNETFTADLTAGPSASPGLYTGTLSLVFTDSSGTTHTQTFPLSFKVEGTVIFILQDTSVSQSTTGFTVTGSILNEGTVAAYYSSISGLIAGSSATPVYLGEIDPNTPTPFSVTIPFTAPTTVGSSSSTGASRSGTFTRTGTGARSFSGTFSRSFTFNGTLPGGFLGFNSTGTGVNGSSTASTGVASVALTLTYQDSFGSAKSSSFSLATTIKSASQLGSGSLALSTTASSSGGELTDIAYGVVGLVVAVLVVGVILVRRYRADKIGNLPLEEKSVI